MTSNAIGCMKASASTSNVDALKSTPESTKTQSTVHHVRRTGTPVATIVGVDHARHAMRNVPVIWIATEQAQVEVVQVCTA